MLVSAEIPIRYLFELYLLLDYPFVINIYKDIPEYRDFYVKACRSSKISFLDNGLFESIEHGKEYDMSLENLAEGVEIFHPTYLFSTEKYGDREYTVNKAKEFKTYFGDRVKIATCCHGSTLEEYMECFKELSYISDCIAFSHVMPFEDEIIKEIPILETMHESLRRALVRIYAVDYVLSRATITTPIHLLGCNHPFEITELGRRYPQIETCDTSSPILCGLNNIRYNSLGILPQGKIHQGKDYIYLDKGTIDLNTFDNVVYNTLYLKSTQY